MGNQGTRWHQQFLSLHTTEVYPLVENRGGPNQTPETTEVRVLTAYAGTTIGKGKQEIEKSKNRKIQKIAGVDLVGLLIFWAIASSSYSILRSTYICKRRDHISDHQSSYKLQLTCSSSIDYCCLPCFVFGFSSVLSARKPQELRTQPPTAEENNLRGYLICTAKYRYSIDVAGQMDVFQSDIMWLS